MIWLADFATMSKMVVYMHELATMCSGDSLCRASSKRGVNT